MDPTALAFVGEAVADAPAFTTSSRNVTTNAHSVATVSWSPRPWPTDGQAGSDQRSPDLPAIVQEIINRAGWRPGDALAPLITGPGRRVADSSIGNPDGEPVLHDWYQS